MSVMREIEDYVLDSPIKSTSAYEKLVENSRAALQHSLPNLSNINPKSCKLAK